MIISFIVKAETNCCWCWYFVALTQKTLVCI